ncbi:uncharacterized protein LOC131659406 [Vicia villosa]|uniref:uncharacterized protein LOC131659406 n=1 Tax=Vicia villosa TaxID=3911 RepID=UPI00273BC49D|nr:uncharacterized protein LOC131659406 [Vicia villosa]
MYHVHVVLSFNPLLLMLFYPNCFLCCSNLAGWVATMQWVLILMTMMMKGKKCRSLKKKSVVIRREVLLLEKKRTRAPLKKLLRAHNGIAVHDLTLGKMLLGLLSTVLIAFPMDRFHGYFQEKLKIGEPLECGEVQN